MDEYLAVIKSLSEKTRIRILAVLHQAKEVCVSEIVEVLEESQYKVSRHLKVLQEAGMVVGKKRGRWTYYQLNDSKVPFNKQLMKAVQDISSDILQEDLERLRKKLGSHAKKNDTGTATRESLQKST